MTATENISNEKKIDTDLRGTVGVYTGNAKPDLRLVNNGFDRVHQTYIITMYLNYITHSDVLANIPFETQNTQYYNIKVREHCFEYIT